MRPNYSYLVIVVFKDPWSDGTFVSKKFYVKDLLVTTASLFIYGRTEITEISLYDLKEFHVKVLIDNRDCNFQDVSLPFPEVEDDLPF